MSKQIYQQKSRQRILYICHDGQLYGAQQSLRLILEHLPRETYHPFISLARSGPLKDALQILPDLTILHHSRLQWVKHDPRSWVQRIGDVFTLFIALFPRSLALAKQIRSHQIDLVHTNSFVSLEGAIAAKLANVPHVWHIRELFMEKSPKLHLTLGRFLTQRLIPLLSDQVICISQSVRQQFPPDNDRVQVIYNAMAEPETPMIKKYDVKHLRIGYMGRLSAGKRFQDLLEAVGALRERNRPVILKVAGTFVDAPYERQIQERLQHLQLEDRVEFLGHVSDLASFYQNIDVLVVPSLNEAFGRVVIESMFYQVPCIGTRSGGIPEIITHGKTGWLYEATRVDQLTQQLEEILANPALLDQIQENAGRMVRERFTIVQQIQALDLCYQSLIKSSVLLK